jgi:hypothetical protein
VTSHRPGGARRAAGDAHERARADAAPAGENGSRTSEHALAGTAPTGAATAAGAPSVDPAAIPETSAQPLGPSAAERRCEVCGNLYDKAFRVVHLGSSHVFDCFECAIHALAPTCARCGCRILGHGMESDGAMYCCAHCAQGAGVSGVNDRADTRTGPS